MTRNPVKELDRTLDVIEIFKSIQGESTSAGMPCIFIRLAGCNLRCTYCDTQYAYEGGKKITIGEILEECVSLSCNLVAITGGEPLIQQETNILAEHLSGEDFTVLVETNGSLPIVQLPLSVIKIMDIKCPGSGESEKMDWSNIDDLSMYDEVKFVISDRRDYEWSRDIVMKYDLCTCCYAVLFAPVFGVVEPRDLASWILEDSLDVRLQLQQHKYIWPPETRGV